jgi:transposase
MNLGSSAHFVLVWLVLKDWIGETPGLTSKVLNVPSSLLSFISRVLQVIRVLPTADRVTIEASPRPTVADCPTCGVASTRIHSVYRRVLSDLPWQGRAVTIRVSARRFRCRNRICSRQTFAERLTGEITRSSRQTERLRDLHRHIAFALGGEAGARLATRLAIPTSPDTLLRLASAPSRTGAPARTPRVLGIDDWAWRRGHRYGTLVVDLETNQVVNLLPDREAGTVAAWLRDRPGVEIVARDRAGAYAEGIRQGAPAAVHVADRWHLLRNLGDAVQGVTDKHSAAASRAAQHVRAHLRAAAASAPPANIPVLTARELTSMASLARRQSRYEEAARLRSAGASITRVAAELGAERKTVRRWLRLRHATLWKQPPSGSMLDPFVGVLTCRWNEGCRNAAQLWRELVSLGFRGRPSTVRHWASKRRRDSAGKGKILAESVPPIWPVPRGYRLARLLMSATSRLTAEDELFRIKLLEEELALAAAVAWAQQFNALLRRKINGDLDTILAAAADTMLARFAAGLRRDFAAISAALELPWTTSPVEGGQISRLKMLKRTM